MIRIKSRKSFKKNCFFFCIILYLFFTHYSGVCFILCELESGYQKEEKKNPIVILLILQLMELLYYTTSILVSYNYSSY